MTIRRIFEIFLAQTAVYLLLWLWNAHAATLVALIMACVCAGVLVVALLAEWVERSKVPRWYYWLMAACVLAPAVVLLLSGFGGDF